MSDNLAFYLLTGLFVLSQLVHGHIVALHVRMHEKQMEYLRQRIEALHEEAAAIRRASGAA